MRDFYYLSQKVYECKNSDISAFAVSNSAKAKFGFPAKDLAENLVDDIRSDSEKVTDILRIWSQILTPDEKLIWSDIAERDLSKAISLNSGIRTPKSFIEKDIKAFRDLKQSEKSRLLHALIKAPNNTSNPCELTIPSENVSCDLNLSHYACIDGEKEQPKRNSRLLDHCPISSS